MQTAVGSTADRGEPACQRPRQRRVEVRNCNLIEHEDAPPAGASARMHGDVLGRDRNGYIGGTGEGVLDHVTA